MSRKSGFSNRLSLEGPRIAGELPHYSKPLGRRRTGEYIRRSLAHQALKSLLFEG
jgi:hypothetical protein